MENPYRIEPALLDTVSPEMTDVIAELSAETSALGTALNPETAADLAALVRIMNSYYSNLIEGHNTRPRDIQRALIGEFDEDIDRRNLQREAAAHVRVQEHIDQLAAASTLPEPTSVAFIRDLHLEFYREAPEDMLVIAGNDTTFRMEPGMWRHAPEHDVAVGRHVPPSSQYVDGFMDHFAARYRMENQGMASRMIIMAAAHHRLNFIHPFPDGNGRVSRLMSHAVAHKAGIGAQGLWSVSRGLARGLESRNEYKSMMDQADAPRRNDHDGRGNLSLSALESFVLWFLKVCLDQARFMRSLFEIETLADRLRLYVKRSESLKPESERLLLEALMRGRFERGEASRITGTPERTARRTLNQLIDEGLLGSKAPKGAVSLRFPMHALEALLPRLYPQA